MYLKDLSQKLIESWETAQSMVNVRTVRERTLLLVTGGVLITAIIHNLFLASLNEKIAGATEEKSILQQQYQATHEELLSLQTGAAHNINTLERPKVQQQLEELLAKRNESLLKFKNKIIPPTRIPYLLESMLRDLSDLKLVSLETIEKVPFNTDVEHSALYKHRVKITFTGEYQNMLRYLKRVEKLPFPIGWESLEYKITRFPQAQIVLTIYMLSSPLETNVDIQDAPVGGKDD